MARYALPEGVLTPGIERKSQCNAEADDLRGHGPHTTLANTRWATVKVAHPQTPRSRLFAV